MFQDFGEQSDPLSLCVRCDFLSSTLGSWLSCLLHGLVFLGTQNSTKDLCKV
jgi:hypothetical protein